VSRKRPSPIVDYVVYLLVRLIVGTVQALSWDQARNIAGGLAWLAYHIDRRHRRVAEDNLRHAFPGRFTEAELDRMVRAVYRHFCVLFTEIVLIPRKLHVNNHKDHVKIINAHVLADAMLSDRPLLLLTCHFGNWELAGYFLGLCGFTTYAVARPLDNPYLDRFLRRFREHTGQKILAKKGDFDQMTELLASGGVLATLADQDAGKRGLFIEFFGRPASTHKAIALMALEYKVPMIVSVAYRVGHPLKYNVIADEVILPEEYADQPNAVQAITQRFTAAMERLIMMAPEQYFWLHNRWKHQPAARKGKRAKVCEAGSQLAERADSLNRESALSSREAS
jgi:KDO2-lipid IV(A) lauroyltransferase